MSKKYNIDAFTSYSTELVSATWSEPHQAWKLLLRTPSGPVEEFAHFVINGHGVLNRPREAMFGGEEEFTANGGVIMHTARFDRTIPLEGRTVAVIGNGSSGGLPTFRRRGFVAHRLLFGRYSNDRNYRTESGQTVGFSEVEDRRFGGAASWYRIHADLSRNKWITNQLGTVRFSELP